MGERVKVTLFDDIDPTKDATTQVHFEYGGTRYRIDLCDENVARFDAAMETWISHARKLGKNGKPAPKAAPKLAAVTTSQEIRAWAAENGVEVAANGKIPKRVVEAYEAAHTRSKFKAV